MSAVSIRQRASALAAATLAPVPVAAWERVFPKDVISICYHVVSDEDLPQHRLLYYKTTRQFEDDLLFVRDRAVTYEQVAAHRLRGKALPPNSLFLTFDDGYVECHTVIRPLLLKHGVDAAFFVATDFLDDRVAFGESRLSLCLNEVEGMPAERARALVERLDVHPNGTAADDAKRLSSLRLGTANDPDKRRLFLWILRQPDIGPACDVLGVDAAAFARQRPIFLRSEQVKQMAADGFTIGAHGLNHRSLEGRDDASVESEIVESCTVVRDLTGQSKVPFAFPYIGVGVNRALLARILRKYPFIDLFFDSGSLRRDEPFVVNRVFADAPSGGTGSNLPGVMRDAWARPSAWFRSQQVG